MFLGTYEPKLDEKGRVILPARFREDLAAGLVITRGQERCLYVFAAADFEGVSAQIRESSFTRKAVRDYMRVFLSGATAETPDRQNRVTIPAALRTYANLDHDLTVIGAGNKLEIWNATAWQDYLTAQESAFAEMSEEVIPGML